MGNERGPIPGKTDSTTKIKENNRFEKKANRHLTWTVYKICTKKTVENKMYFLINIISYIYRRIIHLLFVRKNWYKILTTDARISKFSIYKYVLYKVAMCKLVCQIQNYTL